MGFIFLIPIGILVYFLINNKKLTVVQSEPQKDAMHILDERFAKGEIDEETYKDSKKILSE